jgi:hypothetical protein
MKEYEFTTEDGTKFTFLFEKVEFNPGNPIFKVSIKRWYNIDSMKFMGQDTYFSYNRVLKDKKVKWMDAPGVIMDHTPMDVRRYIEKILKNIAFA